MGAHRGLVTSSPEWKPRPIFPNKVIDHAHTQIRAWIVIGERGHPESGCGLTALTSPNRTDDITTLWKPRPLLQIKPFTTPTPKYGHELFFFLFGWGCGHSRSGRGLPVLDPSPHRNNDIVTLWKPRPFAQLKALTTPIPKYGHSFLLVGVATLKVGVALMLLTSPPTGVIMSHPH